MAAPFAAPVAPIRPAPAAKAPVFDASAMQKFLNGHGYTIPVDGINGPITQAAAADFRGSRNPAAFNTGHGLTAAAPTPAAAPPAPAPRTAAPKTPAPPAAAKPPPTQQPATATPAAARPGVSSTPDAATASTAIQAIIRPLIAEIQRAEAARAAQGQSAIGGYTANAAKQTGAIDFGAPYAGAEAGQNAVNTALMQTLTGAGTGLQTDLASTLAKAGIDPTGAVSGKVGADTAGAAGAGLAKGDATLSSMLASGAAAKTYGDALPGITRLGGLQDTAKLQGQVTTDTANQLGSIQSKVPGMVQSELTNLSTARAKADANKTAATKNQMAAILANGVDPKTGVLTPAASAALARVSGLPPGTFTGVSAKTAETITNDQTKAVIARTGNQIKQENADTARTRASNSSTNADARLRLAQRHENTYEKTAGAKLAAKKGGLTAGQYASQRTKALAKADLFYYGKNPTVSAAGVTMNNGIAGIDYGAALKQLVNGLSLQPADAVAILNDFYAPGERGRPAAAPKPWGNPAAGAFG